MQVKITFAVFQDGQYSEDTEGVYECASPFDGIKLMAELVNNNQFAPMPATRDHTMASEGLFHPPATKEGLGAGTIMVVKNVELYEVDESNGHSCSSCGSRNVRYQLIRQGHDRVTCKDCDHVDDWRD